jgi:hypothetical protein
VAVENTPAYYLTVTIATIKGFIVQAEAYQNDKLLALPSNIIPGWK